MAISAVSAGVFLLQGKDSLTPMPPASFASENDFQRLLSRFPQLLVGDQIDPQNPRRWVLARRELPISTGEAGASQWSIDHVFLDQDGIPTLVEVKRQSDSRIRREVVGQMLDYAANCLTYWSVETLRSSFEETCQKTNQTAETVLSELTAGDTDIEEFWESVKTNLKAKKIRLLFVADIIPLELRRIVEFLNEQMTQIEVLAVELRQFESDGLKVLVPTVYGQETVARRNRVSQRWDEARFFEKMRATASDDEIKIAQQIYEWMRKKGTREVAFGVGLTNGTIAPIFKPSGVVLKPVYLYSDAKLWIPFAVLKDRPIFGPIEARHELMLQFNTIDNVKFTDGDLTKWRSISLATIARDPDGLGKVMNALAWIEQKIEQSP